MVICPVAAQHHSSVSCARKGTGSVQRSGGLACNGFPCAPAGGAFARPTSKAPIPTAHTTHSRQTRFQPRIRDDTSSPNLIDHLLKWTSNVVRGSVALRRLGSILSLAPAPAGDCRHVVAVPANVLLVLNQ